MGGKEVKGREYRSGEAVVPLECGPQTGESRSTEDIQRMS